MEGHDEESIILFISIFFLGSCSISYVTFSSESKSRKGQYKGHIKDDSEDGVFTFQYKGGDGNTEFKIWRLLLMKSLVQ